MPGCPRRVRVGAPTRARGPGGRKGASSQPELPAQTSEAERGLEGKDAPPGGVPQESLALAVAAQGGGGAFPVGVRRGGGARPRTWRSSHPLLPGGSVFPSPFTSAGVSNPEDLPRFASSIFLLESPGSRLTSLGFRLLIQKSTSQRYWKPGQAAVGGRCF